jgi:copper chaperone
MIDLKVDGMTCGGCVRAVKKAVEREDPAAVVEIDLDSGRVSIDAAGPPERFTKAIEAAGYDVAP